MDLRTVACRIYEPDGALLASGSCRLKGAPGPAAAVWIAEDDAERIVHRYIFGAVRDVHIEFDRGPRLPARLERLQLTPPAGTRCDLRVEQTERVPALQ